MGRYAISPKISTDKLQVALLQKLELLQAEAFTILLPPLSVFFPLALLVLRDLLTWI